MKIPAMCVCVDFGSKASSVDTGVISAVIILSEKSSFNANRDRISYAEIEIELRYSLKIYVAGTLNSKLLYYCYQ